MISNPRLKYENKNYQEILDLDFFVLPYLIDDLKSNDIDWFVALNKISDTDPIKKEHQGNFDLMKQDWLEWAEKNKINQYAPNDFRYAGFLEPILP